MAVPWLFGLGGARGKKEMMDRLYISRSQLHTQIIFVPLSILRGMQKKGRSEPPPSDFHLVLRLFSPSVLPYRNQAIHRIIRGSPSSTDALAIVQLRIASALRTLFATPSPFRVREPRGSVIDPRATTADACCMNSNSIHSYTRTRLSINEVSGVISIRTQANHIQ